MHLRFPYQIDARGRTASATREHTRHLIEQVLFTAPGERVNRPDFGAGLLTLVFAPNGDVLASASQVAVQGALQHWLGDRMQVEAVSVENDDSTHRVIVRYVERLTQQRDTAEFERKVAR